MKARQSSVYRNQELLLHTLNRCFDKVPNKFHRQWQAAVCTTTLMSAMRHVDMALRTKDAQARMEILGAICIEMADVKVVVREFSVKDSPKDPTIISLNQYAEIAKLLEKIARDLQKWMIATMSLNKVERP